MKEAEEEAEENSEEKTEEQSGEEKSEAEDSDEAEVETDENSENESENDEAPDGRRGAGSGCTLPSANRRRQSVPYYRYRGFSPCAGYLPPAPNPLFRPKALHIL